MSLSSAWRFSGVFQGPGRRWPKKKPSGSDSEEEEQVGQGLSSLGFLGVCGGLSDAPLGVSRVGLATVAGSAAREVILSSEEAQFQPMLGSGLVSPVSDRSEMPISEPPNPCARGGPGLRAASRPAPGCAVRAAAAARLPQGPPPPSTSGRPRPPPARERVLRCSPAGWVREAFGARRPGTRGESYGPRCSRLGVAVGGRGAAGVGSTAWGWDQGFRPGRLPPSMFSLSRRPLPL